jgi:pimeloyl-ACP methyl ester carboxylesterase
MESAQSHMQLAEALASSFTVYLPDRRGRGASGPYRKDHKLQTDVEDLGAVLTKTGARDVMGVSSGAVICLQAALALTAISKAVIFEPPLMLNSTVPAPLFIRYDDETARGKVASALITGMKAAQMGPPIFNLIPRPLLELLTNMAMTSEDRKATDGAATMRMLAPTLHYDFQLIFEAAGAMDRFIAIKADVLLLGGSQSPTYLKAAVDALEKILPRVRRVELPGLGHGATGNTDRGGSPELVAQILRRFLGERAVDAALEVS